MQMNWKEESEKSGNFETYPEGSYVMKVDSWERTEASTGTPQLRYHFTIQQPAEYKGKTFVDHFALTEKALWRIATFIARCGIELGTLAKMEVGSPVFINVLNKSKGRKVGAVVENESYNGKERNKVAEYILVEKEFVDVDGPDEDVPDFLKNASEDNPLN
jgi:hypothetical protein